MKREDIEKAAKDYSIGKTHFRRSVLKEVDADDYVLRKDNCREDFIAGAEWQSRQMAWISVNDKLPEYGHIIDDLTIYSHTKNVIVLYKNGCIGKGKRIYVNEINKKGWQWSCLKGEDITHWMYFPD